jgi:hypothetical protein
MPCCRIFGVERVDHVSGGRDDERRPIRGGLAFETLSVAARKFDRQRVNTFPKSFACTFPKSILSRTGLHHVEGCRIYWSNTSTIFVTLINLLGKLEVSFRYTQGFHTAKVKNGPSRSAPGSSRPEDRARQGRRLDRERDGRSSCRFSSRRSPVY